MTAVQELIKKIKVRIPFFQYSVYQDDFDIAIQKEKKQIMDSFIEGSGGVCEYVDDEENLKIFDYAQDYYNKTYLCPIHNEALNEDGLCNICLENSNK